MPRIYARFFPEFSTSAQQYEYLRGDLLVCCNYGPLDPSDLRVLLCHVTKKQNRFDSSII